MGVDSALHYEFGARVFLPSLPKIDFYLLFLHSS
jgi:hypothetical protein